MMELFEFLLELLTRSTSEASSPLAWVGNDGEFTVLDFLELARVWGERKQIANIGVDQMREILKDYCSRLFILPTTGIDCIGDILSPVEGKNNNFKFDLQLLLQKVIMKS